MKEYQCYFNHARPQPGYWADNPVPAGAEVKPQMIGELVSRPMLGGLHHDYQGTQMRDHHIPELLDG
jgi:hypothetical protein